jgi:hypothetical protein
MRSWATALLLALHRSTTCHAFPSRALGIWTSSDGRSLRIDHDGELNLTVACNALAVLRGGDEALPSFCNEASETCSADNEALSYLHRGYICRSDTSRAFCICRGEERCIVGLMNSLHHTETPRILALLMASVLEREVNWSMLYAQIGIAGLSVRDREAHIESLEKVKGYIAAGEESYYEDGKVDIPKYLTSKVFKIQVLVIKHMTSDAQLTSFLNELYELVRDSEEFLEKYYKPSCPDYLDAYTEHERRMAEYRRAFLSGRFVPALQDRLRISSCELHTSHDTVSFIDYGRNAILSLLSCMFYDAQRGRYSLDHLPGARKELKEFFRRHPVPFRYTDKIEQDWGMVLAILCRDRDITTESDLPVSLFDLFSVLRDLCGVRDEFPLARRYYTDEGIERGDNLEKNGYFGRLLDRISYYKQHFFVSFDSTHVSEDDGGSYLSGGHSLKFRILSSEEDWMDVRISYGPRRFCYMVAACSCVDVPMPKDLKAKSLTDFFVDCYGRLMGGPEPYERELRKAMVHNRSCIYLLSPRHLSYDREIICALYLLDSAIHSTDFVPLLGEIKERHKGEYLITVYEMVAGHIGSGDPREFDPDNVLDARAVLDGIVRYELINLLCYIMKHKRGAIEHNLEECVILILQYERRDMLEYVDRRLVREANVENGFLMNDPQKYSGISDWHMFKYIFDCASIERIYEKEDMAGDMMEYYEGFYINTVLDPALSSEDIKRIYDWGEALGQDLFEESQKSIRRWFGRTEDFPLRPPEERPLPRYQGYLSFLVENTYERLNDMHFVYGYLYPHLVDDEAYDVPAFFLGLLLRESISMPEDTYLELRAAYETHDKSAATHLDAAYIAKLLLDLEHEGLVSERRID